MGTMCQLDNRNLMLRTKEEPLSSRLLLEGGNCGRRGESRMMMTRRRKRMKIQTENQTLSEIPRRFGQRRSGNGKRGQHRGEGGEEEAEVEVEEEDKVVEVQM